MKRGLLTFLILTILAHAPWRIWGLAAETMVVHPGLTHMSQANDKYFEAQALQGRLETIGWSVSYVRNLNMHGLQLYGLTNTDEHTIYVEEDLSWNARYAILAHEGGHTLQRGWYSRAEGEAFAEAVATVVTHDGIREHARYLAPFKMDALWMLLFDSSAVYRAAGILQDE